MHNVLCASIPSFQGGHRKTTLMSPLDHMCQDIGRDALQRAALGCRSGQAYRKEFSDYESQGYISFLAASGR